MIGVAILFGIGGMAVAAQEEPPARKSLTTAGAPAGPEFDPAIHQQTSLLDAASRQNSPVADDITLGNGTPRAAVGAPRNLPAAGYPGCVPQYGKDGQCLPLVPPSQIAHAGHVAQQQLTRLWTCAEVRTLFPTGVALAKEADPLNLDSNKDRIACGQGDNQ